MSRLEKLTSKYGENVEDTKEGVRVFHISNPHLLNQAAGYLKFTHAQASAVGIYYRGQTRLYKGALAPSLFRNPNANGPTSTFKIGAANKRIEELKRFLDACEKQGKVLKQVPEYAWEPLLQHYGVNTRWVDLVDNVWVALWFACHKAKAMGPRGEYLHYERRRPDAANQFAYIVLVEVASKPDETRPGIYSDGKAELIDLRVAAPSTFVRPHAQTGLLVRAKNLKEDADLDYRRLVAGALRIDLADALEWLGDGKLLTTHSFFPPPAYDYGYSDLLEYARPLLADFPPSIGSIQHIGA